MKLNRISAFLFAVIFFACNSPESNPTTANMDQVVLQEVISDLEKDIKSKGEEMDRTLAEDLLSNYISYSNQYHSDSLAGEYMIRASSIAVGIGKYKQAVDLLINYYEGYPTSVRRPEAVYTIAFIYDEHLRNPDTAARYYQAVIDNHPGTRYAEDAEAALRIVGMTDEQLLKFLMDQN